MSKKCMQICICHKKAVILQRKIENGQDNMQGNFMYHNPTKLYFGEKALEHLSEELQHFGKRVLLNYGSGSVKRSGLYDEVVAILKTHGVTIIENPGADQDSIDDEWF